MDNTLTIRTKIKLSQRQGNLSKQFCGSSGWLIEKKNLYLQHKVTKITAYESQGIRKALELLDRIQAFGIKEINRPIHR